MVSSKRPNKSLAFGVPPTVDLVSLPDHRSLRTLVANTALKAKVAALRLGATEFTQVDIGDGKLPFPALFKQLKKMGYTGCVNMEYEINAKDPMQGMLRSLSYMRGVLAGLAG